MFIKVYTAVIKRAVQCDLESNYFHGYFNVCISIIIFKFILISSLTILGLFAYIFLRKFIHTLFLQHGLNVFENKVLRRICEPKTHENGEWRKLHN